jgi:hypothetical protein
MTKEFIMRNIIFLAGLTSMLASCAQTNWVHPSKSEAQFNMDKAYCANEASRNVQPSVAAPVVPIYTPPNQYNTNCSSIGNSVNCTTTAQPNYLAQIQQQNSQNMAQAGANIGTAFAQQQFAENCMRTLGWSKQQTVSSSQSNVAELNRKYQEEFSGLMGEFEVRVCKSEGFQYLFKKSPCNIRDISLVHLANKDKVNQQDLDLLLKYSETLKEFQNKELEIINKYILPPLKINYANMRRSQMDRGMGLLLELYEGKITWGDYNKKRQEVASISNEERKRLLQPN